jgi:hypothetical protein
MDMIGYRAERLRATAEQAMAAYREAKLRWDAAPGDTRLREQLACAVDGLQKVLIMLATPLESDYPEQVMRDAALMMLP